MPADTSVHFYHSEMTGAPVLSGTAGAMIGVLDACLVNGWGLGTVDSVVITAGIGTVTRGAGHPFEAGSVALIAGATVTGATPLNGERKVLSVISATQYTIDCEGIPNQTATGAITHLVSPAGWGKPFSSTNIGVYRSSDVTGTRMFLRVDDTDTGDARVVGYENMTAVSTGTGIFPTNTQVSGGGWWPKSNSADGNARRWVLVADGKTFYFLNHWLNNNVSSNFGFLGAFGDYIQAGSTDTFRCFINAPSVSYRINSPGGVGSPEFDVRTGPNSTDIYVSRPWSGLGSPLRLGRNSAFFTSVASGNFRSGAIGFSQVPFPNRSDGGVYVAPVVAVEETSFVFRGRYPGLFYFPQEVGSGVFAHRERLTGVQGLVGRELRVINSSNGCFAFDGTGPWN